MTPSGNIGANGVAIFESVCFFSSQVSRLLPRLKYKLRSRNSCCEMSYEAIFKFHLFVSLMRFLEKCQP